MLARGDSFVSRMRRAFSVVAYFTCARLSVLLFLMVGLYFGAVMFRDQGKDTTAISNTAFAIVASLAALSFSCVRAIDGDDPARERFAFVGERFFHAGLLLLMASVLKYALISAKENLSALLPWWVIGTLDTTLGSLVGMLFTLAVISSHTAVRILNELLFQRIARQPGWDDLM